MNITEYCDVINCELQILYYSNHGKRWCASIKHAETKENSNDSFLTSAYGNGESPEAAIICYLEEIRGKILVLNAHGKRREFKVPESLTYD